MQNPGWGGPEGEAIRIRKLTSDYIQALVRASSGMAAVATPGLEFSQGASLKGFFMDVND